MEENKKEITLLDIAEAIERGFSVVATKEDLERFATKEDLERFATKEDLERFATKEDMQGLKGDILELKDKFDNLDARVITIQGDIEDIKKDKIDLDEFDDVKDRVRYVEKKLKIESGV